MDQRKEVKQVKVYRGIRNPGNWSDKTVLVDTLDENRFVVESKPLRHHERHSPDGFEWGYGGSGPSDLALSILADLYGMEVANQYYGDFKCQFVAGFARQGWMVNSLTIDEWLEKQRASSMVGA